MKKKNLLNNPSAFRSRPELVNDCAKMAAYAAYLEQRMSEIAQLATAGNRLGRRAKSMLEVHRLAIEPERIQKATQPEEGAAP